MNFFELLTEIRKSTQNTKKIKSLGTVCSLSQAKGNYIVLLAAERLAGTSKRL